MRNIISDTVVFYMFILSKNFVRNKNPTSYTYGLQIILLKVSNVNFHYFITRMQARAGHICAPGKIFLAPYAIFLVHIQEKYMYINHITHTSFIRTTAKPNMCPA